MVHVARTIVAKGCDHNVPRPREMIRRRRGNRPGTQRRVAVGENPKEAPDHQGTAVPSRSAGSLAVLVAARSCPPADTKLLTTNKTAHRQTRHLPSLKPIAQRRPRVGRSRRSDWRVLTTPIGPKEQEVSRETMAIIGESDLTHKPCPEGTSVLRWSMPGRVVSAFFGSDQTVRLAVGKPNGTTRMGIHPDRSALCPRAGRIGPVGFGRMTAFRETISPTFSSPRRPGAVAEWRPRSGSVPLMPSAQAAPERLR